jgi:hypothetical protein
MGDPNKLLTDVSSRYGAPMGRPRIADKPDAKVRLFRVRFTDGDYDHGGAYWGGPANLYAAIGDGFQAFTRAASREAAKAEFREEFPQLRFYR